jgi:hypothetical protein
MQPHTTTMDSQARQDGPVNAADPGVQRARELVRAAAEQLAAAGVRDEALGVYEQPKSRFGVKREPLIRPLGRVWRIGALLLDRSGNVWATGSITRVTEPGRAQFVAHSAEVRRAYRAAAQRGHFDPGDTVNHGATPIPLDDTLIARPDSATTGPLVVRDGEPFVRWAPTAEATIPLEEYLADRVDLLVHPPEGAGESPR